MTYVEYQMVKSTMYLLHICVFGVASSRMRNKWVKKVCSILALVIAIFWRPMHFTKYNIYVIQCTLHRYSIINYISVNK